VGVLSSALVQATEILRSLLGVSRTAILAPILFLLAFLLPLALLGFILSRRADRRLLTVLAGAAAGTTFSIAMTVIEVARRFPSGVTYLLSPTVLMVTGICAAIGAVVCLAVRWTVRTFLLVIVEDDGSYCLRCGYQIGPAAAAPAITVCPECGAPRDPARYQRARPIRAFDRARRAARPTVAILAAVAAIAVAVTLHRAAPVTRFLVRFDALTNYRNQVGGWITDWDSVGPSTFPSCKAVGVIQRLSDGIGTSLLIYYAPDAPHGLPPMQIVLAVESNGPLGSAISYGTPYVVCDLDAAQAEHVIRHGLPAPLIAEFLAASTRGWSPATTASWPPPIQRIDPAPLFLYPSGRQPGSEAAGHHGAFCTLPAFFPNPPSPSYV
jgi:hypothetical protein